MLSRCDGAVTLDGVGYNKFDSYFVRSLMDQPTWTPKQERALHKLLRKYVRQLETMGISYDQIIPPPEDTERTGKTAAERAAADLGPMKLDYQAIPDQRGKRLVLFSHKTFREQAKAIHHAHWNPDMKAWSYFPCIEVLDGLLPYLIDKTIKPTLEAREILVGLFNQRKQREAVQDIKEGNGKTEKLPVRLKPYQHQDEAFQIGITADQAALLMEQGTGKTLSAIGVAGYRHQKGQVKKLLVVAPLSVVPVWTSEFRKHAAYEYDLVELTKKDNDQRKADLKALDSRKLQVAVINYESTWRCIDLLLKWKPDMIVVDESQKIKNGRAKQSKALHKLGDQTTFKLILSGTPITQGPLDTWSQYRFLNPDVFGRRFISFRDRYARMGGYGGYQVLGYRNLEELASKAHSIAYRVTKAEALDLPEAVDQEITVNLSDSTMRIYKEMEEEFLVKFSDTEVATAPIILTQLLRLQQITGGFLPTEDKVIEEFDSAKLDALRELLEDLPASKKVVIFARFVSEIEAIKKVSQSLGRNPVSLSGATKDRGKVVADFQDDPTVKDIIIQIQTGGLGITLTAADTAVFYSTTFSFADYDQAKARLHRIGQRNPVTYIHILAGGTIDEEVLQILKDKGDMATQIVDRLKGINSRTSTKGPFRNPSQSLRLESDSREGGSNLIGLDNKPKGGWCWDETTGRIIRRDAEDGSVDYLTTAKTLEEAQEIVNNLNRKTVDKILKGGNEMSSKKSKKEAKVTKKAQKTQEPEEVMEEAVEELEEVVEEETTTETAPTKKSKKAKKTEKKAAATPEPAPTKKSKKAKKEKKEAAPAPAPKAEKKAKATKTTDESASNEVSAKELAAQLNIDPKVLRKTLRELYPDHESKERWVWKKGSKELERVIKKVQNAP